MQLTIDSANDSAEVLTTCARFMLDLAALKNERRARRTDDNITLHDDEIPLALEIVEPVPVPAVPPPPPPGKFETTITKELRAAEDEVAARPDLDVDGKEWNAEVHSSSKKKTIDGRWKVKHTRDRGGSVPPVPAVTPAVPPPPVTLPAADDADDTGESDAVPSAPPSLTFQQFIPKVTGAMNAGTLSQDKIHEVQTTFGITSLMTLSTRPELIQLIADALGLQ